MRATIDRGIVGPSNTVPRAAHRGRLRTLGGARQRAALGAQRGTWDNTTRAALHHQGMAVSRASTVCSQHGCPRITPAGQARCTEHARHADKQRGSRQARGYDRAHEALRRKHKQHVDLGLVDCARCGEPINPSTPWDLGHDDNDRTKYTGPEHAACNRGARPTLPAS